MMRPGGFIRRRAKPPLGAPADLSIVCVPTGKSDTGVGTATEERETFLKIMRKIYRHTSPNKI